EPEGFEILRGKRCHIVVTVHCPSSWSCDWLAQFCHGGDKSAPNRLLRKDELVVKASHGIEIVAGCDMWRVKADAVESRELASIAAVVHDERTSLARRALPDKSSIRPRTQQEVTQGSGRL